MFASTIDVDGYKVQETETKRSQDLRRFTVQKPGSRKPYVVTFQRAWGYGCSCPAGVNQRLCKHVTMCQRTCS